MLSQRPCSLRGLALSEALLSEASRSQRPPSLRPPSLRGLPLSEASLSQRPPSLRGLALSEASLSQRPRSLSGLALSVASLSLRPLYSAHERIKAVFRQGVLSTYLAQLAARIRRARLSKYLLVFSATSVYQGAINLIDTQKKRKNGTFSNSLSSHVRRRAFFPSMFDH